MAHGMCLADLDGDGDPDVAVNHLNAAAGIYRNETPLPRVAVRLDGRAGNTRGIGAKITLRDGRIPLQSQEILAGGRYLSGDDPMRTFAAGTGPMQIEVQWRSGRRSLLPDVAANRLYLIPEPSSP